MLRNIGATELIVILALALLLFGAGKLPGVGKALGQSIREFKAAVTGGDSGKTDAQAEADAGKGGDATH